LRQDDDLKYFESQEFKDILAVYESARAVGSSVYMEADELTDIAEYYSMVCHDEQQAADVIALALQLHPDAVDPQIFRARQFMQEGDIETAKQICDAIEDQEHREVYFLRAELLVREERVLQAVDLLEQAAAQMEEDKDYFLYDTAYVFIDYRLFKEAWGFVCELQAMAPDWYKTWQAAADTLLGLEEYHRVLPFIERMLDVDPFSVESWNWSAEAYIGMEDYDEAMNSLDYALAIDPENERALQLKAWIFLQQGNFERAHEIYQKELERDPSNEQNWLYDTYCLLDANQVDEALASIERAEQLADGVSPDQSLIYEMHAQVLSRKGCVAEALSYLDKAEGTSGPDGDPLDYEMLRARVLAENHQVKDALMVVDRACKNEDPDGHIDIYYRAAVMMVDTNYFDIALDLFDELLKVKDTSEEEAADYHAYMAYCCMMLHQDLAALHHLSQAGELAADRLRELFAEEFPGVQPAEYYDYYYYRVNGRWPS